MSKVSVCAYECVCLASIRNVCAREIEIKSICVCVYVYVYVWVKCRMNVRRGTKDEGEKIEIKNMWICVCVWEQRKSQAGFEKYSINHFSINNKTFNSQLKPVQSRTKNSISNQTRPNKKSTFQFSIKRALIKD